MRIEYESSGSRWGWLLSGFIWGVETIEEGYVVQGTQGVDVVAAAFDRDYVDSETSVSFYYGIDEILAKFPVVEEFVESDL